MKDKEKKKFNFHHFLVAMVFVFIALGVAGVGILLVMMTHTNDGIGFVFYIPIVLAVFWGAAVFIGKKIKYYCPNCGERLHKTGYKEETGDISSHENGNTTIFTERVRVEYECWHCKYTKIIDEKHKIGSIS